MMTVPTDNEKEESSRERVQRLLNKNAELENNRRKAAQSRIPSDPNTWQLMRENYEAIILEDHAFSEQHDIEYALWQLHYRRIEELRALFNAAVTSAGSAGSQNGKGPVRAGPDRVTKIRSQFKTFLSEATGFYHDLMLKIRSKYGLPLGYASDDQDNQIPMTKDGNKSSEVQKGLISCHRCLIYLGDLARYKGLYGEGDSKARDFTAASSYYLQASSLWPSSGNPHHQLAILAGYSNNELLSIYRYFRSLAVDNPFITARDNLIIAFEKNRQNYTQILGDVKTTVKAAASRMPGKGRSKVESRPSVKVNRAETNAVKEKASNIKDILKAFITRFVRMNGILFTRTSLETFAEVFSVVKSDILELLSSGQDEQFNFGSDAAECRLAIIRMIAILIFTVHDVNKENENQSYADILQRSVLLQNAFTATFEFMGYLLERCSQLNEPSSSFLFPGIMVFIEWLACHKNFAVGSELEEKQLNARSFFWEKCISFLNKLLLSSGYVFVNEDETCFSNMSKYDESETANRLALPEDFELRGFLPLVPAQLILDFSRKHSFGGDGGNKDKIARVQRIIAAGKALANIVRIGEVGVYFDAKSKKFVFGAEPQSFDDYITTSSAGPNLSGVSPDILVSTTGVNMEDEDDDEVIVFKPSITEKHIDEFSSKLPSSEVLVSVGEACKINLEKENGLPVDSFILQNAVTSRLNPSATVANSSSQYMQPVQSCTSNWPMEHAPMLNGLAHFNLMENRVSQPAALSMPYPQFVTTGPGHNFSNRIPQATTPSMFDSIMSSGVAADGPSGKQSSNMMPPGVKKNPVSRPVRHFGPPPGFGSVPAKAVDESALRKENPQIPQMDDYSWLDGYHQFSSSNQSGGFGNSNNQVGPAFSSVSKSNGSIGLSTFPPFPFPGKQIQSENLKYNFSEPMNQYEEQQQQFQKGNQQHVGPPQPGQSLWEGRFFV